MLIYRFKVTCEESDGFYREIEILPNQTFLDFHHIMVDSSELLQCESASFYITDKKYKKDKEISLKTIKRQVRRYDEDIDQVITEMVAPPLMKNEKVKTYIDDPHQKMIYEFEGKGRYSFHLELFKITHSDGISSYPQCIKRVGELPKPVDQPKPVIEKPAVPKAPLPKIPLPPIVPVANLDDVEENPEEMAAIESELDDLIREADNVDLGELELDGAPEFDFNAMENPDEEERDENLQHLSDFEDIDQLDRRLSGYDQEQDDY